jgi:hypothetical protein
MADPYLQLTFDTKRRVGLAARSVDLPPGAIAWGLWEVWEDVWRRKDASVPAHVLAGCFGTDPRIVGALVLFGFLVEADGAHRLASEDEHRILHTHQQRVAAGKARVASGTRSAGGTLAGRSSDSPAGQPAADQRRTSEPPAANQLLQPAASSQQPAAKQIEALSADADPPPFSPKDLQALYNVHAVRAGWAKWDAMGENRRRPALARLREHPERAWWETVLLRAEKSAFLRGENDRGWRMDPDFFVRVGRAESILEGKYDGGHGGKVGTGGYGRKGPDPNQGIITRDEYGGTAEEIKAANRRQEEWLNGND